MKRWTVSILTGIISVIVGIFVVILSVFTNQTVVADGPLTPTAQIYLPYISKPQTFTPAPDCHLWSGQIPLQSAVNQFTCVEIQSGVYRTNVQITIPSGHQLLGKGQDRTILLAVAPWTGNLPGGDNTSEAVIHGGDETGIVVANFTIDANHLSTFGLGAREMIIDSMRVMNAKCDGIAIAGHNMVVQNNLIENNGEDCPTNVPGSGIYITNPLNLDDVINYAPVISGNIIRYNGGPALDVDRVWGGTFKNNVVYKNLAWTAVSLYSASYWTIEDNTVRHPSTNNILHPGHSKCWGGPSGEHSAALYFCQDTEMNTSYNVVRNNQVSGYYGILSIGNDETQVSWIPRYNVFQGNDVYGSIIGCADDFEPNHNIDGLNTWIDNNCAGTPDTLPLYFDVLCPSAVRRSTVQEWSIGETSVSIVNSHIDLFNANRIGGEVSTGTGIISGVVIATNFDEAGRTWDEFPVTPIVHSQSYGLFETVGPYTAPYTGACLTIVP